MSGFKYIARFYNIGIALSGLFVIYNKAVRLIDLKAGDRLLDVGCGSGTMLKKLRAKFGNDVQLFGVDPSPQMLDVARSKAAGLNITFKVAYGSDLPLIDRSQDWVISTLAFHHMPTEEKIKAVGELARVLKPGGLALISDLGRPKGIVGSVLHLISRAHAFTAGNMDIVESELSKQGLVVTKIERSLGWVEHMLIQKAS
ncbi:MAG: class I SAM-dependent methyltransferase [Candidatus Taylorbacteria bacterium]|nr:class I SAM-dependent methyltransferase [Candidatus Taylorbacteria bacterium]